jgi:hypothetical protein
LEAADIARAQKRLHGLPLVARGTSPPRTELTGLRPFVNSAMLFAIEPIGGEISNSSLSQRDRLIAMALGDFRHGFSPCARPMKVRSFVLNGGKLARHSE